MKNITLYDLVEWVVKHRTGDAFKDYPHNKIASCIESAASHDCLYFVVNSKEEITGIACGEKFKEANCIMLHDIIMLNRTAMRRLWSTYLTKCPNWVLVARYKGKMQVIYRPKKEKV